MFKLIVERNIADTAVTERLTSGSVGLTLGVEFSADWNGLTKRAVFYNGKRDIEVIIDKDSCKIPPESLAESGLNLTVGIRGESLDGQIIIPTVYADLGQIEEGARTGGNNSQPVTPDLVNQIQNIAQSAEDIAQSVRDDANAGKFNGAPGKAPKIGDNANWFVWDDALGEWVDTGVYSGGQAPYIGANGNWYVGDADTGVKAQGERGEPGKDSDVTKAYVDSLPLTIKSDAIPEITDEATLREYFYQLRKSPKRKWQFEISSGKNENIVTGLGGRPDGVSADESAFIYIELPYSEAGGFVIKATYLMRNKADAYEKLLHATYSTPTPTWHDSGWYNPVEGGGAQINDTAASLETVYSSTKVDSLDAATLQSANSYAEENDMTMLILANRAAVKYADDQDAITLQAAKDYTDAHHGGGAVDSVNGKTGAVVLTATDVGALSQSELQDGIDTALAQAKASGEFDGAPGKDGSPGKDGTPGAQGKSMVWGALSDPTAVSDTHSTIASIIKNHTRIAAPIKNPGAFKPKDIALLPGQYNDAPRQHYVMLFDVDKVVGSQIQGYPLNVIEEGLPGKTPVKGVDYWTASDQEGIVDDVLAALPKWTWEAV